MSAIAVEQVSDAARLWQAAQAANLGMVFIGGIVGGLLQPVVARLNPRTDNPPNINFLYSPLLGFAAAGISVYVVANSKTDEPIHLLFFALLCGLAFPSVLTSAVDNVTRRTNEMQQQVANIAEKARDDGPGSTVEAANELKATLAHNPAATVNESGKMQIENLSQQAVSNIGKSADANANPNVTALIIKQLEEVATIARSSGWQGTARAADSELDRLDPEHDTPATPPG